METKDIVLYIITTISLIISVAGYLINRTLYNQNKVFDEKFRAYTKITTALNNMMNVVVGNLYEGQEILKDKKGNWQEDMDELADETDDAINALNDAFTVNSLLLPLEVLTKYEDFATFLEGEPNDDLFENSGKLDEMVDKLNDRFDEIINIMRSDLDSDKLNQSLRKRIRGTWVHKILTLNDSI
jgi:hypothetical protein